MPVDDEFLKNLPASPGVYLMVDRKGKVLYVGKASNLKNRVRSYFVKGGDERPSIPYLLRRVDAVRTILTETEKEALILENNLIKQHRPRYNVNLRDDKSFFSLRLNVNHPYPRLTLVRTQRVKPDGARYFGPYSSARDARITLNFIRRLFPLRQCTERQLETCRRPCLNCQMQRCLCPCAGMVDREEYGRMVKGVILLLQGKSEDLIKSLRQAMETAATELRFEEAARIRDRLTAIERTLEAQNVAFFHLKDLDVVGLVPEEPDRFAVAVLSFRKGNLISKETFVLHNPALEEDEVLASSIKQYYGSGAFIPKEILVSRLIEAPEPIEAWLSDIRGNRVTIRVPSRGQGARLMNLALKNAADALARDKQRNNVAKTLEAIATRLDLPGPPRVIEGYDISNIAGSEPTGVKVSFKEGMPDKSAYRIYSIRDFSDQDDPGMIHQTLKRRVSHRDEDPLPDLFLIDGGKSQLNAAVAALREQLGDNAPPVASIAKVREEGQEERVYLFNRKNPLVFPRQDPGLMLLMRVRDESHRFAHSSHTRRRRRTVIHSLLDDIPGIGPKKRQALLTAFGSVKSLMAAADEEIETVPTITRKDVENLRAYFARSSVTLNEGQLHGEQGSREETVFSWDETADEMQDPPSG